MLLVQPGRVGLAAVDDKASSTSFRWWRVSGFRMWEGVVPGADRCHAIVACFCVRHVCVSCANGAHQAAYHRWALEAAGCGSTICSATAWYDVWLANMGLSL